MSKPRIRFKGFEQEWESVRLGELLNLRRGLTYCPDDVVDKGIRVLRSSNIQDGLLTFNDDDVFVTYNAAVKIEPVQCGNILITAANGSKSLVGKHCIISGSQEHMVHGGFMLLGETSIPKYLNASMYAPWFKEEVRIHSAGGNGSISNLNKKDVDNFSTEIPSETTEIAEIGDFFSYFDNLYSTLLDKITSLKSLKICYLNRLFPIGGGNEPPVRLAGFSGEWKTVELSSVANKVTEKNIQRQICEVFTNSAQLGIISQQDYFDHAIARDNNIDGYYVVSENDFVYNPRISVSAPVGPINRNKTGKKGVVSPLYTVFRTHDINPVFLEYYFKSNMWHNYMRFTGNTGARFDRFSISDTDFFKMPIPLPSEEEQQLIAEYFVDINNLISFHEEELERLKALKESCLQGMFV